MPTVLYIIKTDTSFTEFTDELKGQEFSSWKLEQEVLSNHLVE